MSAAPRWLAASCWAVVTVMCLASIAEAQTVEARLDRSRIALGETTTLRVIVRGANGAKVPEFEVPEGLALAASSRQQSFAWVNGRASVENEFRYEVEARQTGHFSIGPILVSVGSKAFRGGTLDLEVTEAPQVLNDGRGTTPATLRVEARPRDPYVGQEVTLTVRLVQRSTFAEDPQYTPPTTTGFWTDRPTSPESFYAEQHGERVLVTETRTRLFPLAVGEATIGEATAVVVLSEDSPDPFGMFGDRREMVLRSPPVTIRVRPLPAGAPAGFGGAVGRFETSWTADRSHASRDVPITLRLDVRGRGNLPLVRPPSFSDPNVEGLANTTDDSLAGPEGGIGRKRFQWTVLPRREGRVEIDPPAFSWFDPTAGAYVEMRARPLVIEVGPPVFSGPGAEAGFPRALADRPVDPGERAPAPWAFALAGGALGVAWRLWRGAKGQPAAETGATQWLARLRGVTGPALWRAMEEVSAWLEAQPGAPEDPAWRGVRDRIAAARYAGSTENPEAVRRELIARVAKVAAPARTRIPRRLVAVTLVAAAVACMIVFGPRPGPSRAAQQCAAADQAARRGEVERARRVWLELWRVHGGQGGLAARLAWAHVQAGEIGPAALWVLRGKLIEPREPGLAWVEERVREAGGLVGASPPRWPVRPIEWAAGAALLAAAAAAAWPRRSRSAALGGLAAAAALVFPIQGWLAARSGQAVMLSAAPLAGSDVELEPGQMVTIRGRQGERVHVAAGRVLDGWVPAATVAPVVGAVGPNG